MLGAIWTGVHRKRLHSFCICSSQMSLCALDLLGLGSQSTQKSIIIPFYEEEVLASVSSYHSPQPPFKEKAELKFKSSPPPSETHKTHYFTARPVPLEGGEQEAPEASFLPGGKGPSGPRYSQELNVPQTRFSPAGRGDVYKSCATAR